MTAVWHLKWWADTLQPAHSTWRQSSNCAKPASGLAQHQAALSQLCLWCVSLVLLNDLVSFVNMARWCRPANTIASGSKCTPCSPQAVGQDLAWSCRDRTVGLLKSLQVIWSSLTWKMHDGTSALHQNHTMVNHGWQQKRFCMSCTGQLDIAGSWASWHMRKCLTGVNKTV